MMARLLEMGADPRCQDGEGRTCLHLAANNDSRAAAEILIKMKVSPRRSRHRTLVTRLRVCFLNGRRRRGGCYSCLLYCPTNL